jgi:hypothetical protein
MRAIIIEDKDIKALLTKMDLETFSEPSSYGDANMSEMWDNLSASDKKSLLRMVHRKFNYALKTWLNEQGA